MTSQQPRAFFALDLGSATTSAALIGHVGGRWRLVGHSCAPASTGADALLESLLRQIHRADPEILEDLGAGRGRGRGSEAILESWPRFVASSAPPRRIAVLAASRRQRNRLESVAQRSGWKVVSASVDDANPMDLARTIFATETCAVLLGADRSPSGDDRKNLPDLAALVAAATRQRPELLVILAGGAAAYEAVFAEQNLAAAAQASAASVSATATATATAPAPTPIPTLAPVATSTPARDRTDGTAGPEADIASRPPDKDASQSKAAVGQPQAQLGAVAGVERDAEDAPLQAESGSAPVDASAAPISTPSVVAVPELPATHVLLAPDVEAGSPPGSSLQQVLEGLRSEPNDSRLNIARSIASLAYVLDRSMEVVEVGLQGGLVARSEPFGHGHFSILSSHASLVEGSFAPEDPSDEVIDALAAWSTASIDRHRLTDRLNDLRVAPWGNAEGDGATFRLAAAKAALTRLVAAAPEISERPMPELLVAAGGIFASLPASVVTLGIADIVRRSGISQVACDTARVLGPLGTIEDEGERRRLLANLADDILLPMGSLVVPAGVKPGKSAGHLKLKGTSYVSEIELHPGAIQVVDLPSGRTATADLDFRDTVRLGTRGHHFSMDLSGGLVGLLIDLRDVPMRISERPESRRAALEAWQKGMWPEVDE